MRKDLGKYRKRHIVFCTILLIGCLLLSGCTVEPNEQGQAQPTEPPKTTEAPEGTQDTPADKTESIANTSDDPSLVIFRQSMVETPQLFAVAFFGYVSQDADPFEVMQKATPRLCEDLPFLLTIDQDHILGVEGRLFCIVPADENTTVAVNRRPWNAETKSYEDPEVLYRSESGSPILVMCPNDESVPNTEVVITNSSGTVATWSPSIEPGCRIAALRNENGENQIFDFTSYDELSG